MMAYWKLSCIVQFFLFLHLRGVKPDCDHKKEVVCYYASWALYRSEEGQFTTENIDPTLCTNIIYSFAGLNLDLQIASLDPNADITQGGFYNFSQIKAQNPCVRTTLAVGGWNEGSLKYSIMAADEQTREAFAENALKFIAYYGFDGLDLDWEYPTARGGIEDDKKNFVSLLKILKQKLSPWGFKVSIAVAMENSYYDVPSIAEYVDYIHIMAYDVTPADSEVTGLLAPLPIISTNVNAWIDKGASASQLILGIPTYARCFNLEDPDDSGIGAKVASNTTCGGIWTNQNGFLAYYEVLEFVKFFECEDEILIDSNVYFSCQDVWMSYDNKKSLESKCQYVKDTGLGGVMLWSVDTDDFKGLYGEKYPLLTTVNLSLNG
ncbi:acidic mammalian chitinase-like [Euwallacea fornicatus]|uniref:acidic mammalian chitinase-like n=1 Tax=Euwallacea fornicatus TaxID=995702 RepID=UPI00338E155E